MLSFNDLKSGVCFILASEPYEVLESRHVKMAQGRPVMQTKVRNLASGKVFQRTFHQADSFEEADLQKISAKFIYSHRGQYWFSETSNPSKRFSLTEEQIGQGAQFLKPNLGIDTVMFDDKVINVNLPIKIDLKIKAAPPGEKGNTAQGGTKPATLETGAKVNVPLFVNEGDVIRVNTQTQEYVERVSKK